MPYNQLLTSNSNKLANLHIDAFTKWSKSQLFQESAKHKVCLKSVLKHYRIALRESKIQKFSGGACPQTPKNSMARCHSYEATFTASYQL